MSPGSTKIIRDPDVGLNGLRVFIGLNGLRILLD